MRCNLGECSEQLCIAHPQLPVTLHIAMNAQTRDPTQWFSDLLAVQQSMLRQAGAGRVVYFPWDIDRTFWEVLSVDHFKLLRNTVKWATNETQMVEVTGPGVLDVVAWQNQDSIVVHLVNLTNPMTMKGPYREFVPVGAQSVRVRLPAGTRAKKISLLVAEKTPVVQDRDSEITINVPSILDHEVVAIDL